MKYETDVYKLQLLLLLYFNAEFLITIIYRNLLEHCDTQFGNR